MKKNVKKIKKWTGGKATLSEVASKKIKKNKKKKRKKKHGMPWS